MARASPRRACLRPPRVRGVSNPGSTGQTWKEAAMATSSAVHTGTATWQLDAAHSSVEFSVKHMMMTTVRGRFKNVTATLTADEEHPEGCCVEVEIDVASIDTGSADRDAHLRSADFFDAEKYPKITFRSKRVEGHFNI